MIRMSAGVLALLLAGCSSVSPSTARAGASDALTPSSSEELVADLEIARRELAIAELKAAHRIENARAELEQARSGVVAAERELQLTGEKATLDRADLEIDLLRDQSRLEESRAELAELEAMYSEEEFAKTTKELVLRRGRTQVELAERGVELARAELELKGRQQRSELAESEAELESARFDATKAEQALREAELETELELLRARREVTELERKAHDDGDSA